MFSRIENILNKYRKLFELTKWYSVLTDEYKQMAIRCVK